MAMEIRRHQVVFHDLQQLRNAQLVHAGFVIVSLVAKRFVETLRQPHRDDARRLVGLLLAAALLPQPRQHLLDFRVLLALFEFAPLIERLEELINDPVYPHDFTVERDPIRVTAKSLGRSSVGSSAQLLLCRLLSNIHYRGSFHVYVREWVEAYAANVTTV
jgi:hypothetical protein